MEIKILSHIVNLNNLSDNKINIEKKSLHEYYIKLLNIKELTLKSSVRKFYIARNDSDGNIDVSNRNKMIKLSNPTFFIDKDNCKKFLSKYIIWFTKLLLFG